MLHLPAILSALPTLVRWESPRLLPAAVGLGAALAAAVVWLYPAQVRLVRRPWRWVMPGLRAAALLALAVALARPVAVRRESAGVRGTVAILIDRSGSMNVADVGRSQAELVALADALGLLPPGARGGATTRPSQPGKSASTAPAVPVAHLADAFAELRAAAQQASRAQGDLDYALVSGQGVGPAQARRDQHAARVAELARALSKLAGSALAGPGDAALRERLQALARIPGPGARGGWVAEVRRRLEQADTALTEYQIASDRRLYESDPAVRAACSAVARRSRFDLACAALLRPDAGLVARLGDRTRCVGFAFADRASPLGPLHADPSAALAAPATPPAEGTDGSDDVYGAATDEAAGAGVSSHPTRPLLPVKPDGPGTDPAGAVTAALARLDPGTVRAVVVVSDGREVGSDNGPGAAPAAWGVPVFTVATAPAAPPHDLALDRVRFPSSAFVGETVNVRASVRGTGMTADPGDIRLRLGEGPERPPDRKGRHRDGTEYAEFSVRVEQPGAQQITLTLPPVPGEATDGNNSVRRWLKVMPTKIRVAAYAGTAGWDFQYLRGALSRTDYVQLEAGVLDPARPALPLTPEQILRQDVLVLYDVPVGALDANQWDAVYNKLVRERGGSVILVAGSGNAVLDYGSRAPAAALLPFDPLRVRPAWKVWPGERPNFRLLPVKNWENADFAEALRLEGADTTGRRWQDLPPMYRVMPVPAGQLRPNAQAMLIEPESGDAVLSETRPGLGRSLLMGTDETWRWRLGVGERLQDRFWLQLVRFAAEEPYAAREGPVALDVEHVAVAPGQPVRVRARLYEQAIESAAVADPAAMRLEVLTGGRVVRTAPLSRTAAGSGRWEATLNDLPEGDYELQFQAPAPPPPSSPAPRLTVPLHVTGGMEAEMHDVAGDPDRLRRLAESTGGEMLRLDQIAGLPDRLANLGDTHPRVAEIRLWDSPYLFAFVVACFAAEWALRKRIGLA